MDKVRFYRILDIDDPEEFRYYENLAALLEADEFIEENLIRDLLRDIDINELSEHIDAYFEDFLKHIPDDETDLYIMVESMKRVLEGMIFEDMDDSAIHDLAAEIARFRKWYVHDAKVIDRISGAEKSVRDARFDTAAARLLGDQSDHDFRPALDYGLDGFDVRVADMISRSESPEEDGETEDR